MREPNLDIKGIEAAADHFNDQIEIHMELAIFHTWLSSYNDGPPDEETKTMKTYVDEFMSRSILVCNLCQKSWETEIISNKRSEMTWYTNANNKVLPAFVESSMDLIFLS